MGVLQNVRSLDASDVLQKKTEKNSNLPLWCSLLAGSARKTKSRKCHRFTISQKQLMEECFDVGEKDKRKRHTMQSCQQLMETKLGKGSMLTTRQIASYWGAYKRRKVTK